ncbi:hypothetical protein A7D21_33240 [Pseudomonas sp. AP19]|uniref:hypothetical protein n=1 Tax=Pseudomonas sp. AP19 TaxID=1535623 RepID=UPI00084A8350|nr:hypothetical protein [Pseudomonas sp. AP19]OEC65138.1 hypothetical protein A7D21_33240 [Pseudomonas sp. AP19]
MIEVKDINVVEPVALVDESPVVPPAEVMVTFSDVSVKTDKTFVVTIAGNRCHVTQDYNEPLFQAVRAYLDDGGKFSKYSEDVVVESDPLVLARLWAETSLQTSETLVAQYRDSRDLGGITPITAVQFTALLTWRQALRDWPKAKRYPAESSRPNSPEWLSAVLKNDE